MTSYAVVAIVGCCVLVAVQSLILMRMSNRLVFLGDALMESLKESTILLGQSERISTVEKGTGGLNVTARRHRSTS